MLNTFDQRSENQITSASQVAVLVPCLNEELTIAQVVQNFKIELPTAIVYVFDNNSTDHTCEVAERAGAKVILSPMRGKGNVVRHMFESIDADIYLMVDGDGTYPAKEAPKLILEVETGRCDMAVAIRMQNFADRAFRPLHQFGNHLVAGLIRSFFSSRVTDVMSGYRAFSREFVKTIPLKSPGFEIETEMTLQAITKNFVINEIPVHYGSRPEGSHSKLNTYRDGFLVLKSLFMILKDYRPLVFFSILGSLFLLASLVVGAAPILDYFETHFVSHVPSAILAAGLGILAFFFFFIGLILDTIARYHNENFMHWRRLLKKERI